MHRQSLKQALVVSVVWALCLVGVAEERSNIPADWLQTKYDRNGDGGITQGEIIAKKRDIFRYMDGDSDGDVTFAEYEQTDAVKRQALLQARFHKLDVNQDGRVTEAEYTQYLGIFEALDVDGDGTLTPAELKGTRVPSTKTRCLLWFCLRFSTE